MKRLYRLSTNAKAYVSPDKDGNYYIDYIHVPSSQQGKGQGGKLLKQICDDADSEGINIFASPYKFKDIGLSQRDLRNWYIRHGFKPIKEKRFILMRKPE